VAKVFINFRNRDGEYVASLISGALAGRFGEDRVFRSSDSIRPGVDFAREIMENLAASEAVVAVIGPHWLDMADAEGRRRLLQVHDWVRVELATALAAGKLVIPVLLDGVERLSVSRLPDELAGLAALQSLRMSHREPGAALDKLIKTLTPVLGRAAQSEIGNVPALAEYTVAREGLLASLHRAVGHAAEKTGPDGSADGRGTAVPVLLRGAIGVGKSRLAAEYARWHAGEYGAVWWIDAQDPRTIPAQFAALAAAAGLVTDWDVATGLPALFGALRRRGRWMVVFDAAAGPAAVAEYLPSFGPDGDVIITSRTADWGLADVVTCPVSRFERDESLRLLARHLGPDEAAELEKLAAAVDDLPLAVTQAAALLKSGLFTVDEYTRLLPDSIGGMLALGAQRGREPASVAAAWDPALARLAAAEPGTAELVGLLSVLGAAPVPFGWLTAVDSAAPGESVRRAGLIKHVADSGLIPVEGRAFHPYPLFQSYVRDRTDAKRLAGLREKARALLAGSNSADSPDPLDPRAWDLFGALLPHVFAVDLAASPSAECRSLLLRVAHHLVVRGDARGARDLAGPAFERWWEESGPDDPLVIEAASQLARAQFRLGDYAAAAHLDEDVLARRTLSEGPESLGALEAAHDLAMDRWALGKQSPDTYAFEAIVEQRRRALGPEHPETLRSIHNLAHTRRACGDYAAALDLDQPMLRAQRERLGADHPDTLRSAYAVALDLRGLGQWQAALEIDQDTYARAREQYGADHPDTLRAAFAVALGLFRADDLPGAVELAQDTLERRRRVFGDDHADTANTALLIDRLSARAGMAESAGSAGTVGSPGSAEISRPPLLPLPQGAREAAREARPAG
jgi:tetratricopeptide (TPR) repeat protein